MTTQELRTVLYEPAHDILTMRTVIDTLAARGYKLTSDASLRGQLDDLAAEVAELREAIAAAQIAQAQAEDAQHIAEDDKRAADERAQAEADRADGAESHLRRVLVEYIVTPATGALDGISDRVDVDEIPEPVLDSVAESLMGDLDGGLDVVELPESARGQLHDWAEEQR